MEHLKTDNPLQYDIHPLDFIRKKTIKELDEVINIAENGLSSGEKNDRASLGDMYEELGGKVKEKEHFLTKYFMEK